MRANGPEKRSRVWFARHGTRGAPRLRSTFRDQAWYLASLAVEGGTAVDKPQILRIIVAMMSRTTGFKSTTFASTAAR